VAYTGPANVTFDDRRPTPPRASSSDSSAGTKLERTEEVRHAAPRGVLANYTKYFGPKAANPSEYFETDWSQMI
jgi:hypothetical protein